MSITPSFHESFELSYSADGYDGYISKAEEMKLRLAGLMKMSDNFPSSLTKYLEEKATSIPVWFLAQSASEFGAEMLHSTVESVADRFEIKTLLVSFTEPENSHLWQNQNLNPYHSDLLVSDSRTKKRVLGGYGAQRKPYWSLFCNPTARVDFILDVEATRKFNFAEGKELLTPNGLIYVLVETAHSKKGIPSKNYKMASKKPVSSKSKVMVPRVSDSHSVFSAFHSILSGEVSKPEEVAVAESFSKSVPESIAPLSSCAKDRFISAYDEFRTTIKGGFCAVASDYGMTSEEALKCIEENEILTFPLLKFVVELVSPTLEEKVVVIETSNYNSDGLNKEGEDEARSKLEDVANKDEWEVTNFGCMLKKKGKSLV